MPYAFADAEKKLGMFGEHLKKQRICEKDMEHLHHSKIRLVFRVYKKWFSLFEVFAES